MNTHFKRSCKESIKRGLHVVFEAGQRFGLDILPRHFYSSIPCLRELNLAQQWRKPQSMIGVDGIDLEAQLSFAAALCTPFRSRIEGGVWDEFCAIAREVGYGPADADFLFCFIASKKPRRIVQIGCGVSTAIILGAAAHVDYEPQLTCIEPYPSDFLKEMSHAGKIRLERVKAQDAELDLMTTLGPEDLLFVDSTHTVKPGSEVNRIVFEVLPRLGPGTYVHFHDINFPYDYQPSVLRELFFSVESSLLHAFLVNNVQFTIRVSLSMLHYGRPEKLRQLLPCYLPQPSLDGLSSAGNRRVPSALYLQTLARSAAGAP